jgi:hypothetical protein
VKVSNEIEIKSTLEEVWEKTIDIEAWPSWNPVMSSVVRQESGDLSVGSTALIDQQGMKPCVWTVQEIKENEIFSWKTNVAGIKMFATHEIKSNENSVQNVLTIDVGGFVGFLLWPFFKKLMLRAIVQENKNFKKFCEGKN